MAIIKSGISKDTNGKIGNIVIYELNGQTVSRTIGKQGKPSKKQLANYLEMKLIVRLLAPMKSFINISFEPEARGTTKNPYNLATAYNKNHAIQGKYPDLSIDHSKVILSRGNLKAPENTRLIKTAKGVEVLWDKNADTPLRLDDLVMILLYHPLKKVCTKILYAVTRAKGKYFIPLKAITLTQPIEAYICFKSIDGKLMSDSVYAGNLNG